MCNSSKSAKSAHAPNPSKCPNPIRVPRIPKSTLAWCLDVSFPYLHGAQVCVPVVPPRADQHVPVFHGGEPQVSSRRPQRRHAPPLVRVGVERLHQIIESRERGGAPQAECEGAWAECEGACTRVEDGCVEEKRKEEEKRAKQNTNIFDDNGEKAD
jgi:hypothetical protein